jgi:hypothetical protein
VGGPCCACLHYRVGHCRRAGHVAIHGTINGHAFETILEPDGLLGHGMNVDARLGRRAGVHAGTDAVIEIEPPKARHEPRVPQDLRTVLDDAPAKIRTTWKDITPMARWEWVRWVKATRDPHTRRRGSR